MTKPTALALDPECVAHDMGAGHPESPARLSALIQLAASERVQDLGLLRLGPRLATEEDVLRIHRAEYVAAVAETAGARVTLDVDAVTSPRSFEAARRATGAALAVTDAVCGGDARNGFALVRPPGHHAEPYRAMGFCLFNNVAIAATHARAAYGHRRIAVVDFDVHHGNGTQTAFWSDPDTLFVSTHQFPFYPGSGAAVEVGAGAGAGATINIPLGPGHGDGEYAAIYGALIPRILEQFQPDLILVSAGYDLMADDPLGSMRVTADGVGAISAALVAAADRLCAGRIAFLLEGGYDLPSLRAGVLHTLEQLIASPAGDAALPELDLSRLGHARRGLPVWREHFRV